MAIQLKTHKGTGLIQLGAFSISVRLSQKQVLRHRQVAVFTGVPKRCLS
ncbi:hypothetical protein [Prevotella nigrescens]|nr:hypothetical protein [Prevotella nigrescens]